MLLNFNSFKKKKKKIGVIGLNHGINIGNSLLKYAMFIQLTNLGFIPYLIGTNYRHRDISFLKKYTNCIIIKKNFTEIKRKEYDYLMVNSDQTWRRFDRHFYNIGFLKFAEKWNIPKFIYGASLGYSEWKLTKVDENIAKNLLKNFTGISVREKGSVNLVNIHFGVKPLFVLDPTLLINKKYYLNIIKNYKPNKSIKGKYIFTYIIKKENNIKTFIKYASKKLGYKVYNVRLGEPNSIEKFLYGIVNSKAVITNSFHGTIFSIIFKKPFVTFIFKDSPKERLLSLKNSLEIKERIIEYNEFPNITLLTSPINLNYTLLKLLRIRSINYIKKNLGIIK